MNIEMLLNDFNVYCLDENNWLIDNDSLIDYEISHNGVYVNLISIEEGHCSGCDEFDFYIVGNDFYNYSTDSSLLMMIIFSIRKMQIYMNSCLKR